MDYPDEYTPLKPGGKVLTKKLLAMGGEIKNRRVLDLGCGRGETAGLLAEEYGASVAGADLSAERIEECRKKYPGNTFTAANAEELPFADGSFDILVSECCFSVFSDPRKALREAYRVLSKDGILLLSDLWKHGKKSAGRGMVRNIYSRDTWEDMITGAGFLITGFTDAHDALTEMYIQMIMDQGIEAAQRQIGICLPPEEMKSVSYMLLAAKKEEQIIHFAGGKDSYSSEIA